MQRCLAALRIHPGREAELDHRLATAPAALRGALTRSGLADVTVFRRGTDAWLYARAEPDRAAVLAALGGDPAYRAWLDDMRDVVLDVESPDMGSPGTTRSSTRTPIQPRAVGARPVRPRHRYPPRR